LEDSGGLTTVAMVDLGCPSMGALAVTDRLSSADTATVDSVTHGTRIGCPFYSYSVSASFDLRIVWAFSLFNVPSSSVTARGATCFASAHFVVRLGG